MQSDLQPCTRDIEEQRHNDEKSNVRIFFFVSSGLLGQMRHISVLGAVTDQQLCVMHIEDKQLAFAYFTGVSLGSSFFSSFFTQLVEQ